MSWALSSVMWLSDPAHTFTMGKGPWNPFRMGEPQGPCVLLWAPMCGHRKDTGDLLKQVARARDVIVRRSL